MAQQDQFSQFVQTPGDDPFAEFATAPPETGTTDDKGFITGVIEQVLQQLTGQSVDDLRDPRRIARKVADLGAFETAAGAAGTALTRSPAGGMAAASLARMLRGAVQGETTEESRVPALIEGGLEGIPVLGKGLQRTARFLMNTSLKPGIRVLDDAGEAALRTEREAGITRGASQSGLSAITGPGETLAARFPETDISGEALQRRLLTRFRGLREQTQRRRMSAAEGERAITDAEQARPPVRGFLPEGQTAVPLGDTPVPTGGQGATPLADVTEFRRQNSARRLQGLHPDDPVDPIFGGQVRAEPPLATADVVEGAGTVRRTLSDAGVSAPTESLVPGSGQMIGPDESLLRVRELRDKLSGTESVSDIKRLDKLIEDFFPQGSQTPPINIRQAQRQKRASQAAADKLFVTGRGPIKAQFRQALGRGSREAVERRVPGIDVINRQTQTEIALEEALKAALNKESVSSRMTRGGLLDNPRLFGVMGNRSQGLGDVLSSVLSPGTSRFLQDILSAPRTEQPERRQIQP